MVDATYKGRNEVLAACGRDTATGTGKNSSMPLFAEVLEQLAKQSLPISVHDWFHEVDSEVVRRNSITRSLPGKATARENWYYSPSWKLHPRESWPRSIMLRPKTAPRPPAAAGRSTYHVYAKISVRDGKFADVAYALDRDTL